MPVSSLISLKAGCQAFSSFQYFPQYSTKHYLEVMKHALIEAPYIQPRSCKATTRLLNIYVLIGQQLFILWYTISYRDFQWDDVPLITFFDYLLARD